MDDMLSFCSNLNECGCSRLPSGFDSDGLHLPGKRVHTLTCHLYQEGLSGLPSFFVPQSRHQPFSELLSCSWCSLLVACVINSTNLWAQCWQCRDGRHHPWVKELTVCSRDQRVNMQLECTVASDMTEIKYEVYLRGSSNLAWGQVVTGDGTAMRGSGTPGKGDV